MSRKSLSLETKLAAALRLLLAIPYTDAKQMTAAQLNSLVQWHHDDPHAISGNDHHSNLRPLLIRAHRERTPADAAAVRKSNRVRQKQLDHESRMAEPTANDPLGHRNQLGIVTTRWMTREECERLFPSPPPPGVLVELAPPPKLRSRGFDKTKTRGFDGRVRARKRRRK